MKRFVTLTSEEMNENQQAVWEEIQSGPRGASPNGPFMAWLQSPTLADCAQKLGEYLRFHAQIDKRLAELAILTVARHWTAQFEWFAHKKFALEAGLSRDIIDSIQTHERPNFANDDEAAVYDFSVELQKTHQVSDAGYNAVMKHIGQAGAVDLVGLLGYYTLVSMTLNVYQVNLPGGEPAPLNP
ncbi:MAG TPA: carboxymuconolactone decarboxylase family protein [Alphaproteobacteria bacterium]|nr:carboxymuconolactone decarboxylase family protein [Alphaproteobacteria bacterium]